MKCLTKPIIVLLIISSSCTRPQEHKTHKADDRSRIENLIERYQMASENEDFAMLENTWAVDAEITLIGTDSHEKLNGWQAIRSAFGKQFSLVSNMLIAAEDLQVNLSQSGTTAWFSQRMKYNFIFNDTAYDFDGLRLSGVAEKRDDEWRLVQIHLSVPAQINIGKLMSTP